MQFKPEISEEPCQQLIIIKLYLLGKLVVSVVEQFDEEYDQLLHTGTRVRGLPTVVVHRHLRGGRAYYIGNDT